MDPPPSPTQSQFNLFQAVANPARVDFDAPVRESSSVVEGTPFVLEDKSRANNDDQRSRSSSNRSFFQNDADVSRAPASASRRSDGFFAKMAGAPQAAEESLSHRSERSRKSRAAEVSSRRTANPPRPREDDRSRSPPPPILFDTASVTSRQRDEIERERHSEKIGYLHELMKMKQNGVNLTRDYSTNDALEDIEFEYERQKISQECDHSVRFMKDMMRLGFTGLELLNAKFGPFLQLDGWSDSVTADMSRYDSPLERIYKKVWRKGSMNPFLELAMVIGGSLFMHHVKMKVMGGISQAAAPTKPSSADRGGGPMGGMGIPFNLGPFAQAANGGGKPTDHNIPPRAAPAPPPPPPPPSSTGRPKMRRPTAPDGAAGIPDMSNMSNIMGGGGGGGIMDMLSQGPTVIAMTAKPPEVRSVDVEELKPKRRAKEPPTIVLEDKESLDGGEGEGEDQEEEGLNE